MTAHPIRLLRAAAAVAALCAVCPGLYAQDVPTAPITTDTAEYCVDLQHMVQQRGSRLPEVRKLFNEGRRMCDHGEIRAGITRLRQALILSRHHIEQAPPLLVPDGSLL
jgi:hypothetical protein